MPGARPRHRRCEGQQFAQPKHPMASFPTPAKPSRKKTQNGAPVWARRLEVLGGDRRLEDDLLVGPWRLRGNRLRSILARAVAPSSGQELDPADHLVLRALRAVVGLPLRIGE